MLMSHEDNGGEDWFQVGGRFDISSYDFQELTSNVLSKVSDLNIHKSLVAGIKHFNRKSFLTLNA